MRIMPIIRDVYIYLERESVALDFYVNRTAQARDKLNRHFGLPQDDFLVLGWEHGDSGSGHLVVDVATRGPWCFLRHRVRPSTCAR